ncbi:involucrin repeat [Trichoderma arundinaceum]|uniref:Involucrin repeat n=1 Tax=Trichoderma arundinaceum TaxID=490622 RepID=A0A395NJC4_TRIAR|nr:involucrin repeat [Trichoderma arundinaceum]
MPLPRRRSPESFRRRRREKRQSREDPAASMYSPKSITTPQQMPGTYNADSPQQQQQPYQPPPQQPYQPLPPSQQQQYQQYQQHQQYQQQYPESFPKPTSQPMPQRQTTPHDAVEPRSRASSGSLSSSPSSSSSSYMEISRQYPTSRYGGFFSAFMKAPSEVRRRRRRRGSGTKKRRGVLFGGSNSSHSSINSDMAYGTGFVKKEKDRSTRYSSSVAGSVASGSQHQRQPQQQRQQQQQHQYSQYPAALPNRPSPKQPNEGKRDKTDEEIIAIGRQLSDIARRANEEDLRAAGKSRPSGLASTAAAITALRKSRKEAKKRGLAKSKKHRDSSSDESDWESASDDDDSSDSSSSDDSAMHLAYGGIDSSRSNVTLPGVVGAAAGAVAASVVSSHPTHSRKSSVVDPRLFGPVNSLRGLVHTPCGFGDEQPPPPSTGSARRSYAGPDSGPGRFDNDRPPTGESQADAARRPGSIPLEQPVPMVPVSSRVFEAGRRDSRNSYRRQLSNDGSLDPTLSGGVAAAAAAAAARMADRRGPWTEDRIYRDDVKLTRPDPDEEYFQRDQAPFEELERRRANPEVYYNRRGDDDVDSPRQESNRQMPDYYGKGSSDLPRDGRTWMELHPDERKESLRYQTTYDAYMRDTQGRQAQPRDAQRQQQQQQQQQQQTARPTKAGDRNMEKPAQPVPNTNVDPFQYQVADDAFNTPQFNTPRPLTPQVVTVERVPNFTDPSPASAPPPPPPQMTMRPQTHSDVRLSRKDSFEIERAAEERRRGGQDESRGRNRDPRSGYEYEQEEREARSILDEAKHSTIPVAAVAVASAIAVEEERSRERRRREYSDDGSRDRSRPHKDTVQEDADRYYRESVIARKIASDEIRSRSKSPDESVVDKWEKPQAEESFAIVTPPNMEDREHDDDSNPYAPPNADVRIDNEIFPYETGRFRVTNGVDVSRFRSRDVSCERERPLLNIVRPTPVPSPDPTSAAREDSKQQPTDVPASREVPKEPESLASSDSSEDEESEQKGDATHSSPSGKSVSWGENSTKRFVVETPETRSRAESPNELAEAEEKPRPRLSKVSQWGRIAAMMASGTSEPTTELDRSPASRGRDLPAGDDVNGTPPVPGPKPVGPELEQMPGTYADDLEFAATVAAGLEESGFDPNIVIDDPNFRRRDSRPGTNEIPVRGHVVPEKPAEETVTVPPETDAQRQDELARRREEEEFSLTDTEDEDDEKTQKQQKLNVLEKYLQMRQSGEIKPPAQSQESVEPPAVQDRPVTPPQQNNNERRNMLEKFLQRRQSGEIQPPREVLEAADPRNLEPVPEAQDEDGKKEKIEKLEKFLQMRQARQTEEPEAEATEGAPKHESDPEQPPTRRALDPEALAELEESVSDFASSNKSKKKKKKKRRDRYDELSTVSSRFDDDHSRLSVPGDEGTELSRVSAPGDEGSDLRTVYSVEDWEDWDSSPRSTRKSLVASELSTSSRRSTRAKRRSISEKDQRENGGHARIDDRSVISEAYDEERKPRSRESKSSQYNDDGEKPVSSRKRKDSGKKAGLFSGIFKSGGKKDTVNEKRDSFFEQAGTLGAGAGLASSAADAATALTRSNAADVSSDPENISRELPGSGREFEDSYPVIAPRAIAIDPQYGDLLPLPPSEPGSPVEGSFAELPGLPDSRPDTPVEDRNRRFEKTHRRQRSNQENLSNSRNRSFSNTAVPLALLRGIGSNPSSPVNFKPPRTPPRPTSWDSTKEFMPLMLLEHARRGMADKSLKGEELPPLPPSEVTSEAEGGAASDLEDSPSLRHEDFRSPMTHPDGFDLDDRRLRLQTDIPVADRAVADVGSEGSTPKADLKHELPVHPTDNTIGEAAARYEFSPPGPRTIGNDRPLTDDYDEAAPVESTFSSGQSARTVDAQAIPSPTTPTRRHSPRKVVRQYSEELTSADEPSDAFETAHASPADMHDDDDDLYEPPPIEPSMLGAIPEFSRPAKFFEDKVPEHSELASMDKVIETLPSIESVPKDQAQARQGSPNYPDTISETAEESSKKGKKNRSMSPEAELGPTADETMAAFVEVRDVVMEIPEEPTPFKESKAKPVTIEDEPELEGYASEPEYDLDAEPITVFEPLDEVVEATAPDTEAVDILPVSDELSSDAIAEYAQRSDPEAVEEIIIGTLPDAASRSIAEAKAEPILEQLPETTETLRHDNTLPEEDYPRKPEASAVIEDSEDSDSEEESDEEEDDSEDSDESEEEEEEHTGIVKQIGEESHAVYDMSASIETLGAVSVVSTSSKKSKKKKKKKKKRKRKKRKSKSAAAAAAAATAAEASHETPIQHATESTEPTILPITKAAPDVAHTLPAELDKSEVESSIQPTPVHTVEVEAVEEVPLDVAKDFIASGPAPETPEKLTREIVEEPTLGKPQEAAAFIEPVHGGSEHSSEHIALAETEEPRNPSSNAVENTKIDIADLGDALSRWAATDSEPIPHSAHVGADKARALSPELDSEKDVEKEGHQVEGETITEEKPANVSTEEEQHDSLVQDREALVIDEMVPAVEETLVESPVAEGLVDSETKDSPVPETEELASVPLEESSSADREWAAIEDKEQDSEGIVAVPEYEQELPISFQELPTIMEEPGFEEANAAEGEEYVQSELDQDVPVYNEQLSPIMEESMEDLLEESAAAETSEPLSQESTESKEELAADESVLSVDQTEETKALESIAEELAPERSEAVTTEDASLGLTIDESSSRSIHEIAETAGGKDNEWPPIQLPSFASDISEPLFTQGDVPSDYPTQQSPISYEPTQMDESFVIPAEPSRLPPPPPPPSGQQTETIEAVIAPSVPDTAEEVDPQMDESLPIPEEPSRAPPPPPPPPGETIEQSEAITADVDAPALEQSDKAEESKDSSAEVPDIIPSIEEIEHTDEHVPTVALNESFEVPEEPSRPPPPPPGERTEQTEAMTAPSMPDIDEQESAGVTPEPELKAVESLEEGDKSEETQQSSASFDLEPTKQEQEPDTPPETRELAPIDESQIMEEQQPETDKSSEEILPVVSDLASPSPFPASEEESKTQNDVTIEQPSGPGLEQDMIPQEVQRELDSELPEDLEAKDADSASMQEPETIPPQEFDRELNLDQKLEQEADADGLKPPMDDVELETGDSGNEIKESDIDVTGSDTPLETGPSGDSHLINEEEYRPAVEDNDNGNLDGEKEEEKTDSSDQRVEVDSTNTLEPSVEANFPQESNMTSELEQPTLEAELEASPVTPPEVDEKVDSEHLRQTEASEQMDLAQDGAVAPVSTTQDPSEEIERATGDKDVSTEVDEVRVDDSQEAKPQMDRELTEPTSERQGSAVAEDLGQFEAPVETVKDDTVDTTDPITDTNDVPHLDKEDIVVDEALSDPTGAVESDTHEILPVAENKLADGLTEEKASEEQAINDLQPEVPSTDTLAEEEPKPEEPQPESKPSELPLEEAQQELKSEEPELVPTVEEADRELNTDSQETQLEPTLEDSQQEPKVEELQPESTAVIQEPKLEEPHPESSDDDSEHEAESKELQAPTIGAPSQEVDKAALKKTAKKEKKKARKRARAAAAAAAAAEEAAADPVSQKDAVAEDSTVIPEVNVPVDITPAEAINHPIEEKPSADLVYQLEPETALPTDISEGVSKEPIEESQVSVDPADAESRQPIPSEAEEKPPVKHTSSLLTVPEAEHADYSESELEDSDDDDDDAVTVISDTASYYGDPESSRSRLRRPSFSMGSGPTGFEVTAVPREEQHAHRAIRGGKKKKKKSKHKHKRKKSKGGSEPSSSLTSLGESVAKGDGVGDSPFTSNTNLEGDAPQFPIEIRVTEAAMAQPTAEPAPFVAESREISSHPPAEQEDAYKPESPTSDNLSTPRQDEPKLEIISEDAVREGLQVPKPNETTDFPDDTAAEITHPPEEPENTTSREANESGLDNRDVPSSATPENPAALPPLEEDGENAWDVFTSSWGKSADTKHESDQMEEQYSTQPREHADDGQIIEDAPLVDEPLEISTPQRRNSQTEHTVDIDNSVEPPSDKAAARNGSERATSESQADKRDSSASDSQSPRSMRPGSASSQGGEKPNRWFSGITGSVSLLSERFGGAKKKTRDRDKDPDPDPIATDKEDPKEESFLGNPASRKSGDERSWEINQVQTIDDFLNGGDGPTTPTTPNRRKRRQNQAIMPTTPKRSESIVELGSTEPEKGFKRGDIFGGELVGSPDLKAAMEILEPLGPFELLRRNSQVEDPIGGLLREASASEISVLPPMDMMSEYSDYDLSDYRLSPPRALPAVEELPEAEAEATASEVGFYRDSGFSGSIPSRSRRHSTSTIPFGEDEEKLRDSGIDGDWVEAAMAQLKTPEPMNRTPERQPQRRLRRSTLGAQRLRDTALRDAAQDPERKTIPGTRERVLTGTGTRPETPTGRSSPTRKGYGAIAGMGIASRLSSGRASPMPAFSDRSETPPPALRRSVTSPPVAGPLRSLRRAVSAQIGPGLQRPESPSLMVPPSTTEQQPQQQPRSVSDSHIPSATATRSQSTGADPTRPDPSGSGSGSGSVAPRSPPNSGLVRQRTPERLKISHQADAVSGSTVRSSSNPTPPLLRRADKRAGGDLRSLRQQSTTSTSGTATVPPASEAPVANEGRVRAKDKTDIYDGYGEGRIGSPLSPTRPHSMRRRQSMQVLELEARVEQLIAENRLLSDARHSTEQHLSHRVVTALSDRDTQIESLKQTLKFLRGEVSRLTEVNDGLTSANAELANKDNSRYADLQVHADRGGNQDALMRALHEKDAQIADLTAKLDAAKERIRELQRQILESKAADVQFLNIKDEDYFDHRCQQLCSHVQQWVLRFSKFSDMRACRLTSEINDEKIIDRLDNAVLDGSDVDRYLNDRVRRRDIFMSMTMNMIWEFVFTRYLFGMDREQRQKLKSLEKLLTEVGPAQAVRQWRAVTLTLLSKRDSFKRQRDLDTEAVVQAIYQTLCKVLPPPSNLEAQIQAQLRRVMHEAVHLSIEMRTQKAEYMMLPPLQPEYDADGELVQTVQFNASMMSERSGSLKLTNEELEAHGAIVRVVLFPLVVKKGDDDGSNDEEIVVCPAQVLIARSKLTRQPTPSTDGGRASAAGTGRLSGGTNSPDTRPANAI